MKLAAGTPQEDVQPPSAKGCRPGKGSKPRNHSTRNTRGVYIQFNNPNILPEGTMLGKTIKPRRNELHTLLGKKERAATSPRYSHRTTAPTEHPSNNPKGSRTTLSDPSLKMEHEKIVR